MVNKFVYVTNHRIKKGIIPIKKEEYHEKNETYSLLRTTKTSRISSFSDNKKSIINRSKLVKSNLESREANKLLDRALSSKDGYLVVKKEKLKLLDRKVSTGESYQNDSDTVQNSTENQTILSGKFRINFPVLVKKTNNERNPDGFFIRSDSPKITKNRPTILSTLIKPKIEKIALTIPQPQNHSPKNLSPQIQIIKYNEIKNDEKNAFDDFELRINASKNRESYEHFLELLERYNEFKEIKCHLDSNHQELKASNDIQISILRKLFGLIKKKFGSRLQSKNDKVLKSEKNTESNLDKEFEIFMENINEYYENKKYFQEIVNNKFDINGKDIIEKEPQQQKKKSDYVTNAELLVKKHEEAMKTLPRDGFNLFDLI